MTFRSEAEVLAEVERRAKALPLIIKDTEGTGVDWRYDHTVGYVLTFGPQDEDSYYLPFRHESGPNYDPDKCMRLMRTIASLPDKRFVFHHAHYDLMMLGKDGVFYNNRQVEDTIVNEALLDEYARKYKLDACLERRKLPRKEIKIYEYIKDKFGLPSVDQSNMAYFWKLPADDEMAHTYAKSDGIGTWHLYHDQHKDIDQQNLHRIHDIESRLLVPLANMKRQGVKVDTKRLERHMELVDKLLAKSTLALPEGLNVNSPTQMAKWFNSLGIDDYPRTQMFINAKGKQSGNNPSFPEWWLEKNPHGQKVVAVRKLKHMGNSFLRPLRDEHLFNGRVHPNWNQTKLDDYGTVTYRLSCNDPNMQQAHKRNPLYGIFYRTLFIPDEGMIWDSNDLVQCEPYLLAHLSGCRVLKEGFLSEPPIDAHEAVARAAKFVLPDWSPDSAEFKAGRQKGKTMNQSLITGMGKKAIIAQLGADGAQVYDGYFRAMPEIKEFLDYASQTMRSRGYINTLLGHRCRLEKPGKDYLAANRALQTGNADVIKYSMVRIEEEIGRGADFAMLLNVHDALDFQHDGSPSGLEKVAEARRIFADFGPGRHVEMEVPLRVDTDEGPNWAEATWGRKTVSEYFAKWGEKYE